MSSIKSRKHPVAPHVRTSVQALAVLAAGLSLPMGAQAQTATATDAQAPLPKVKITSQREKPYKAEASASNKLTQPLLDTPKTVQVVKKEMLQEQGAATLMDALRNTPGITMQLGENGATSAGDTFQMRGFSSQSATFVDGMRDLGAVTRDVFNLEQVEVVKGPSGADIGRGAAAGYINLISKQPLLDTSTDATLSLGTAGMKRLTADHNQRLGASSALRLNVMVQDSGVDGRDVVKNKGTGIAPSLALGLGSPTRVYLYSQHLRQNNVPDGGIPTVGMEGFYNANATIQAAGRAKRENYYGSAHDRERVQADMASAKLEMDLGGSTVLRSLTRYGQTDMDRVLTGVNAPAVTSGGVLQVARTRQRVDQRNEILGNQTSVVTRLETAGITHDLSAGFELMVERQRNLAFTNGSTSTVSVVLNGKPVPAITIPPADLYAPNFDDVMGTSIATGAQTDGRTTTQALYVFDTLTLNPAWKINGGLRVEHYNTSTNSSTLVTGGTGGNLATYAPQGYGVGALVPSALSTADWLTSWNVGAVFKPSANGSIYTAYANSLNPPGGENFALSSAATSQANAALDPQKTTTFEFGTKWDLLERRLNVSAALYRTTNKGQISYDDLKNPLPMGNTEVDGLELAAVGQLTNFWQLSAGIAKMKTRQTNQWNNTHTLQTVGVRWSPDLTASIWTSYTLGDITLGGGVRYVSDQKRSITTDTAAQNMPKIPSYAVADLMASYKINKMFKLQLNVGNLFDKEYISVLNGSGSRTKLGTPRSASLMASVQF